ncbi:diadenylate cyclase CdaA [Orenia marismortui]|uniref:Diadenylate cyclase n=1 Tax=Orenia marismortui TaxID=46469 RepID=A0A4R8H6M9_9FIRM|nr:diadenylate cyclase CdaA [Orenia marismortui]TDX50943.1 diadenylate cyclase [Orenia marismortui]
MEISILMLIDILVTLVVSYKFFTLVKETRAIQLLNGVLILLLIRFFSGILGLKIFNSLLDQVKTVILIALPIVFQPELRRALEHIGRGNLINQLRRRDKFQTHIDKLVAAIIRLSKDKIGALIVVKRATGLKDIIDTGIELDAILSVELLINIFTPNSPLHDGAIIIDKNRLVAANCLLPITKNSNLKQSFGTRHRAALGISEESDALVIVVSEETGVVSITYDGRIESNLDEFSLKERLFSKFDELGVN